MSAIQREEAQLENTFAGGGLGLLVAGLVSRAAVGAVLGPGGALVFILAGALVGYHLDPEE